MKVAIIQMDIEFGEPSKNLFKAEKMIRQGAMENPDVIILPELWNTGYNLQRVSQIADQEGFPCAQRIGELAGELGINIIAGSVADKRGGRVYNTAYVYNREGKKIADYSKIHLFGLMKEHNYLVRGSQKAVFQIDGIECGLIICYDLRFPELSRALALAGAKVIFIPAQWPHPRLHPWRILNQARALENQLYVVAVNRVGVGGKERFFGHSMVVDPLGDLVYEAGEGEEIKIINLNLNYIEEVRQKMTCLKDRVEEAYK
jgi:omega-amidase